MKRNSFFEAESITATALLGLAIALLWLLFPGLKSEVAAAWIQGIGALVGIGIAIAVPARQRQLERQDAQRKEAEIDLVQWGRVYDVVVDTGIFHRYVQSIDQKQPRANSRQDLHVEDLLRRIGALEMVETRPFRARALGASRRALHLTQVELARPWVQSEQFNPREREELSKRIANLETLENQVLEGFRSEEAI